MSAEKSPGEKLTRISKMVDIATIVGALIFAGLSPVLATTVIEFSVVTLAGAEIVESEIKRRKPKS